MRATGDMDEAQRVRFECHNSIDALHTSWPPSLNVGALLDKRGLLATLAS